MDYSEQIKNEIEALCKANQIIHISICKTRPRVIVEKSPAKIVGVYKNIFQLEECENVTHSTRHTFRYVDVLTGQIMIEELNFVIPTSPASKK